MSAVDSFLQAVGITFTLTVLAWITFGIVIGIILGALPGMGAPLGMAVVLPLTLPLDGITAIIFLVSIYSGSLYGGSISAILVNVPGTSAAAATTFDGYPMSRKGLASNALAISATASTLGGFFTILALFALSPIMINVVLAFQTPEYFVMTILGLAMIAVVAKGAIIKGFITGAFGFLLSTIGIAPMAFEQRYVFGFEVLYNGLDFVAVLMGLFAITEMIKLAGESGGIDQSESGSVSGSVRDGIRTTFKHWYVMVKSAFIGMGVGTLPGAGSTIANFVAYAEVVRSKTSEQIEFGEGNPLGVIAAEASNNGTVGGSLIPTFSFGIPGSASTAVLLGGLLMHGLNPGPDLFSSDLHITYSAFLGLLIGNVIIIVLGLLFITRAGYITQIDTKIIIPFITVLTIAGGYTIRNNWVDPLTILVLGIIGYFMVKYDYSIIAFVLGVVLGPIAESNYYRSLLIAEGSHSIFFTRPISLLMLIATVLIVFGPALKQRARALVGG